VTEYHKKAQKDVGKAWLGWVGAETSDGFMDNGFIVHANCLRISDAWWRKRISPISVSHWSNVWQASSVKPGCINREQQVWTGGQTRGGYGKPGLLKIIQLNFIVVWLQGKCILSCITLVLGVSQLQLYSVGGSLVEIWAGSMDETKNDQKDVCIAF